MKRKILIILLLIFFISLSIISYLIGYQFGSTMEWNIKLGGCYGNLW